MARLPQLMEFAGKHALKVISVADLIRYRIGTEVLVRRLAEARVPTVHGEFRAIAFENVLNGEVHLAMVRGEISNDEPVYVRVHTQSVLGDVFGSLRDDHGAQLQVALRKISEHGSGIVLYLKQEMRGVGLADQLNSYQEADRGSGKGQSGSRDPVAEVRDYGTGAQILHELGVRKLVLLSNRPPRLHALEGFELEIVGHLPLSSG
ncbi:MAG: bifunctional 3,4-dihydroxy-2-butanone-4-phosphate synthase/GTP cyclohydrolase II, partial [Acidobacteriota bacterium]